MPSSSRTWYFSLTIFLSAFLLFQIQPLIGKYILPWFGGGPAVWTASMMFFQVLLLGGYTYAHLLSRLKPAAQGRLHLALLLLVLAYLALMGFTWATPITPGAAWKPGGSDFPVWRVVLVLGVSVGLPYFLLSTTSSLIQAWFSRLRSQSSPYAFYILSNAASFIALLSYPVLVEPNWTIQQQAWVWAGGFGLYALLAGFCGVQLIRGAGKKEEMDARLAEVVETVEAGRERPSLSSLPEGEGKKRSGFPPGGAGRKGGAASGSSVMVNRERPSLASLPGGEGKENGEGKPSRRAFLGWMGLAGCASVMLLATTNQMCQDIASIPFLWVVPLSLYLLSFIFAFTDWIARFRGVVVGLTLVAVFLGLWSMAYGSQSSIVLQIAANSLLLFFICVFCHSELYRLRPHPRYLTSFYLALSAGGAAGGVFVSLIAPLIFKDFWEYPLGLVLCALIVSGICFNSRGTWLYRLRIPVAVVALTLSVFLLLIPALWVSKSEAMLRNFYGVIKVRESQIGGTPSYDMMHGAIVHGSQAAAQPAALRPTRYYTESSGVGLALANHPRRLAGQPLRVGLVGLGVGTLAAYGQAGDTLRFYEIDPAVIQVAQDPRYFSYLSQGPADVQVIAGDGRISLERERQAGDTFDLLVIDAFSGESIPTHLVSQEAIALYLDLLNAEGVLAFHITNRHINLEPVLARAAECFAVRAGLVQVKAADGFGVYSTWVLFTPDGALLDAPALKAAARALEVDPKIQLWTDDYSNLFQVLW